MSDSIYESIVEQINIKTKGLVFRVRKGNIVHLGKDFVHGLITNKREITSRCFIKSDGIYVINPIGNEHGGVDIYARFIPVYGVFILQECEKPVDVKLASNDMIPYIDKDITFNPFLGQLVQTQAVKGNSDLRIALERSGVVYYQREEVGDMENMELIVTSVSVDQFLKKVNFREIKSWHKVMRGIFGAHMGSRNICESSGYAGAYLDTIRFHISPDISQDGAIEISLKLANAMFGRTGFGLLGEEFSFRGMIEVGDHLVYAKGHAVCRKAIIGLDGKDTGKDVGIYGTHFLCKEVTFKADKPFIGLRWSKKRNKVATNSIDTLQSIIDGASKACQETIEANMAELLSASPVDLLKKYDEDSHLDLIAALEGGLLPHYADMLAFARVASKLRMKYDDSKKVKEELPGSISTYPKPYIPQIHRGLVSAEAHELLTKGVNYFEDSKGFTIPVIPFVITQNSGTSFVSIDNMNQWFHTYFGTMDLDDQINPVRITDVKSPMSYFIADSTSDIKLDLCIGWRYPAGANGALRLAVLNESSVELITYKIKPRYSRTLEPLMETPVVFVDSDKTMALNAAFANKLEKPQAIVNSEDFYKCIRPLDEGVQQIGMGIAFNVHLIARYTLLDKFDEVAPFQLPALNGLAYIDPSDYLDWLKGSNPAKLFFNPVLNRRLSPDEVTLCLRQVSGWICTGQLAIPRSLEDKVPSARFISKIKSDKCDFKYYEDPGARYKMQVYTAITEFKKALNKREFEFRFTNALKAQKPWALKYGSFSELLIHALTDANGMEITPNDWLRTIENKTLAPVVASVTGLLNKLRVEIDAKIEDIADLQGISLGEAEEKLEVGRNAATAFLMHDRLKTLKPVRGGQSGQMGYINALGCAFYDAFLEGFHSRIGQNVIWDLCVVGLTRKSNGAYVRLDSFQYERDSFGDIVTIAGRLAFKAQRELQSKLLHSGVVALSESVSVSSSTFGLVIEGDKLRSFCISIFDESKYLAQRGNMPTGAFMEYLIRVSNQFLA